MCIYNYIKIISLISLWPLAVLPLPTFEPLERPVFRIANGEPAKLGEFPYQIALKQPKGSFSGQYYTFCGGGLIADNKVLTAAHCLFQKTGYCEKLISGKEEKLAITDIYAVAATIRNEGSVRGTSYEQWRKISASSIPSGYTFPEEDIAVLITKQPFEINQYVSTLPFATKHIDYGDRQCTVSGYGQIAPQVFAKRLMWAYVLLIKSKSCSEVHGRAMTNFICSSDEYVSVLYGDSGGALVCFNTSDPVETDKTKGVIVGVVCAGAEGAGPIFTRVSSFKTFVENSKSTNLSIGMMFYCILMSNFIRIVI